MKQNRFNYLYKLIPELNTRKSEKTAHSSSTPNEVSYTTVKRHEHIFFDPNLFDLPAIKITRRRAVGMNEVKFGYLISN